MANQTQRVIVFHGTTPDLLPTIQQEGLRPGSYAADSRELAHEYAWQRARTSGADSCVVVELDVPDAAVEEVESWWWARGQLMVPAGCPPSCIVSVEESEHRPFSAGWWGEAAEGKQREGDGRPG